jgi:predicted lipoprotein with Yx(FWY)xxD motif
MESRLSAEDMRTATRGTSRRRAARRVCVGAAAVLAFAACDADRVFFDCSLEARASIAVTVVDSVSRVGLGAGSTLILEDGGYRDSVSFPIDQLMYNTMPLWALQSAEREGTYNVRVRRPGYQLWERRGVRVTADRCHVRTVELEARLQASP